MISERFKQVEKIKSEGYFKFCNKFILTNAFYAFIECFITVYFMELFAFFTDIVNFRESIPNLV
jgi:hypothetical protein